MGLDQFDNSAKTRPHVGRESFHLISDAGVEKFNDPCHPSIVLHFCNTHGGNRIQAIERRRRFETDQFFGQTREVVEEAEQGCAGHRYDSRQVTSPRVVTAVLNSRRRASFIASTWMVARPVGVSPSIRTPRKTK